MSTSKATQLIFLDFEVFGKVQGVFFRKYTQKQAKSLNIRGWCRNTSQDTVEGQLEGEEKAVASMKHWLQKVGSPDSGIDSAKFSNEKKITEYTFTDFKVRH